MTESPQAPRDAMLPMPTVLRPRSVLAVQDLACATAYFRAVLFLLSNEARHITGAELPMDGGYTL